MNKTKKEKAIERARKLMAMAADSSSPNEAAIAARRARSIMDQYQIDSNDITEKPSFDSSSAGKPRFRIPVWEQVIAANIATLNDCIARCDIDGRILFSGFSEDTEVSRFMFLYITENGKRACKQHIEKYPSGCRTSFKNAYGDTIRKKTLEILAERTKDLKTATGKSLVLLKLDLVTNEFGNTHYGTAKSRKQPDPISHIEGVIAGKKTNIVTGLKMDAQPDLLT